jgi:hypothetical protein
MAQKTDHDMIVEMYSLLVGNGRQGLCKDYEELKKDFYAFRRSLLLILGVLVGSGMLGIGVFELVKACGL